MDAEYILFLALTIRNSYYMLVWCGLEIRVFRYWPWMVFCAKF